MPHPSRLFLITLILLIPIALTLFPFGWLGEVWPAFGVWLGNVFFNEWAHAAGHSTIFLLLSLALLLVFPALRTRLWLFYTIILVAAVGQEFFQLLYKHQLLVYDDSRDIFTDFIGATLAFIVWRYLLNRLIISVYPLNPRTDQ